MTLFQKKTNKKKIRIADICVLSVTILIACICSFKLLSIYLDYRNADAEYDALQTYIKIPEQEIALSDTPAPVEGYAELTIDTEQLKNINADYTAWIDLPLLDISYPIVQGADNDKYLQTSFEGNMFSSGCIFMDANASSDFSDYNTFIYGHNMKNGSMFGSLKKFRSDKTLCERDPYFYIYKDSNVYKYEIFAYALISPDSELYATFEDDTAYDTYYQTVMRHNQYDGTTAIDWTAHPRIVSLSTCAGNGSTRFLVQGALVESITH